MPDDTPTQYDSIDVRTTTRDGSRIVEIDGYYRPLPESKPAEYRRHAIADLTESQARDLHDRLGALLADLD